MTFGERLKELRNRRGLNQSDLESCLQMSTSSVAMWETDSREPDMKMIIAIAEYFEVTTDYLLTGKQTESQTLTPYSRMIKQAVEKSGLTMAEISDKLKSAGHKIDRSYISKLSNNPRYPASDEINIVLAELLGIDSLKLRTLAWMEKIPSDILENIKEEMRNDM